MVAFDATILQPPLNTLYFKEYFPNYVTFLSLVLDYIVFVYGLMRSICVILRIKVLDISSIKPTHVAGNVRGRQAMLI